MKCYDLIYNTSTSFFPGSAVPACSSYSSLHFKKLCSTRSSNSLVPPLARRDWQRSPSQRRCGCCFPKFNGDLLYIIKNLVSYNFTTDIGGQRTMTTIIKEEKGEGRG